MRKSNYELSFYEVTFSLYDIELRGYGREVLTHICNNMVRVSE